MICHTTKELIAFTLRELMKDQPLRKIKVQDVMRATGMTRQSFYYHFQDIYQVIQWELDRKLFQEVSNRYDLTFFQWYRHFLDQLDLDLDFYRRVLRSTTEEKIEKYLEPIIMPYVYQYLFDQVDHEPNAVEAYTAHIVFQILYHELLRHIDRRTPLSEEEYSQRLIAMDRILIGIHHELSNSMNV